MARFFNDDAIHRPKELSNLCAYQISTWFERVIITRRRINKMKQQEKDRIVHIEVGEITHVRACTCVCTFPNSLSILPSHVPIIRIAHNLSNKLVILNW